MTDRETHPSYGLISFSRRQGGDQKLFGSSVISPTTICMRVTEAEVEHKHGINWYSDVGGKSIVEVKMSAAQFAELLTSMNCGNGVPCTIYYRDGVGWVEAPPEQVSENTKTKTEFENQMRELDNKLLQMEKRLLEVLDKKAIGKLDRETIKQDLSTLHREIRLNIPFMLECFEEGTEKVLTQAKAEVDAFITTVVQNTGLEVLRDQLKVPALDSQTLDTEKLPPKEKHNG